MANHFKDLALRRVYTAMMKEYRTQSQSLFAADGSRRFGNGHMATHFWRGFDGPPWPDWDTKAKRSLAYACFRAGQDAARGR